MCGAVRYLRTLYSEVVVVCKDIYYNNVKMMYKDDAGIRLVEIDSSVPEKQIIKHICREHINSDQYDLYLCGLHKSLIYGTPYNENCNIHRMFYNDMNLDISILKDHFKVSNTEEATILFNKIPTSMKIIFVHNCASNQEVNIDISRFKYENILIVNPNKNMYNINDVQYNLANEFLDKPLLAYVVIMKNADEVHLTDSSFSCLAGSLLNDKIKPQQKYLYTRSGNKYPDLFDSTWNYIT